MADGARKDEEVEDGVHVLPLVQRVEHSARDVAHALSDNPREGGGRDAVEQGLQGDEHAQAHADEAEGLQVRVLLQPPQADDGAGDGTRPDEDKQRPAPVALLAQRRQCQRRVGAGYVPVDGGVVPLAEPLLPLRVVTYGVIDGRGHVGAQHPEEVEYDTPARPVVVALETPDEEDDAKDDTQQDAPAVRRRIPYLLPLRVTYHAMLLSFFPCFDAAKLSIVAEITKQFGKESSIFRSTSARFACKESSIFNLLLGDVRRRFAREEFSIFNFQSTNRIYVRSSKPLKPRRKAFVAWNVPMFSGSSSR